jgi:hypothetical protein
MGKSSPSQPAAPDPTATASAQTSSNIATANAQAALNRNNQVTPWGSQTWSQGPRNPDGTSSWTSTITLDPAQQQLLNANNQISQSLANLSQTQAGNVASAINNPVNYNAAPAVQSSPLQYGVNSGAPGFQTSVNGGPIQTQVNTSGVPALVGGDALAQTMRSAQNAAYQNQAQYLDTRYNQQQHDLENTLVQQGVLQNSDAWNRAMGNFSQQRTADYNNAYNNSFSTGLQAQGQLYNQGLSSNQNAYGQALSNANFANAAQAQGFDQSVTNAALNNSVASNVFSQGLAGAQLNNQTAAQAFQQSLQARNQNLTEQQQAQQTPINLLNALRSGSQVTSPTFGSTPQGNVANTDIAGLYNQQYQGALAGYNGQIAQNNAIRSGLFGLGSAYLLSDRRLKTNIVRIGTHPIGVGVYTYDYIWGEPSAGVMADELERVLPAAVSVHPSGYKMVNYGML